MSITVTAEAWRGIEESRIALGAQRSSPARLALKSREFGGLTFTLYFVDRIAITTGDVCLSGDDGDLLLDPTTAECVADSELDYDGRSFLIAGATPAWSSEVVAAFVASDCGLRGHSEESKASADNKFAMRELLSQAGLLTPSYRRVHIGTDPRVVAEELSYPCVLKPLALSASCGVMRADNQGEFVQCFERLLKLLRRADILAILGGLGEFILVEAYIPGDEIVVEGLVSDGRLDIIAVIDKPDPLVGPFFEESIYVRPSRFEARMAGEIRSFSQAVVTALGLSDGPVHIEARVNEHGLWALDVGARTIGGKCSRMFRFVDGRSLEEIVVMHALGQWVGKLELIDLATGVMMIPTPVSGVLLGVDRVKEAEALDQIDEIVLAVQTGHRVEPPPEGMEYLGFIFASDSSAEEVTDSLRDAHGRLRIRIAEHAASDPVLVLASGSL